MAIGYPQGFGFGLMINQHLPYAGYRVGFLRRKHPTERMCVVTNCSRSFGLPAIRGVPDGIRLDKPPADKDTAAVGEFCVGHVVEASLGR